MTEREKILDWVQAYTNDSDLEDEGGVSLAIDRIKKHFDNDPTILSKSISRYSKTTAGANDVTEDIRNTLKPYIKAKRVSFI